MSSDSPSPAPHDHREPPSADRAALVMFGLTGDLGEKKLLPALADLARADLLRGPVIGVGRSDVDVEDLWKDLEAAAGELDDDARKRLDLHYFQGDSTEAETYRIIDDEVTELLGPDAELVVYCALPPKLFAGVAEGIAAAGLAERTRLVVEKPFGHDVASAQQLHTDITEHLPDERLFAVDHFLAKSAVENLLTFRSANPMVEAAMRSGTVDHIEVTMAESFGIDGRGSFYDPVGAVRDVVQNHLLQTVAVLLMDPPADDSAATFDASRATLLGAVRPLDRDEVVLGQFEGYRDVHDVDDDSKTETYVAATFHVDDDRWRGVPIVVRTGKELAESYTEAVVAFTPNDGTSPNRLRFQLKPDTTIAIEAGVLDGDDHGVRTTTMWACGPSEHGDLSDYATMLAGALEGDHRHFARIGDIVAAWRIVEPIVGTDIEPALYEPGSMGPEQASSLVPGGFVDGPLRHPDGISRRGCA